MGKTIELYCPKHGMGMHVMRPVCCKCTEEQLSAVSVERGLIDSGHESCALCPSGQGQVRTDSTPEGWYVECVHCGMRGPVCPDIDEAKAHWNNIQRAYNEKFKMSRM